MLYLIILILISIANYVLGYIVGKKLGNVYGLFIYDPNNGQVNIKLDEMPNKKKDYIILKYSIKEVKDNE